jgi:LDH2 family malate/lactate/ureidoglycolate dehydrogenase
MNDIPNNARLVSPDRLKKFVTDALLATGIPAADAAIIAPLMVEADLSGADGHGIFRLPQCRNMSGGSGPAA